MYTLKITNKDSEVKILNTNISYILEVIDKYSKQGDYSFEIKSNKNNKIVSTDKLYNSILCPKCRNLYNINSNHKCNE